MGIMIDLEKAKAICEAAPTNIWDPFNRIAVVEFAFFARTALPGALEEIESLRTQRATFWEEYRGEVEELKRKLALAEAVCEAVTDTYVGARIHALLEAWRAGREK